MGAARSASLNRKLGLFSGSRSLSSRCMRSLWVVFLGLDAGGPADRVARARLATFDSNGRIRPGAPFFGLAVLVLFPLRHKLWKPMPLGWYDTPLTARIHWHVIGQSGTKYRVPNSFMCPHERLYGRVNGCFFAPHPVVTYHLGEVWKPELRDAIREAGPSMARLENVRCRFGIWPNSNEFRERHLGYLQAFFCALNHGAQKDVLPSPLRWLKAPGDQLFYWGDLAPTRARNR